jgi:methanogenic corrinoid protein MtbC1
VSGGQHRAQLVVRDVGDGRPRRNAGLPERFGLPHVSDAGDEPLAEQRVADGPPRLALQVLDHRREVGRIAEDVGAEAPDRLLVELEHGPVQEQRLLLVTAEDEPRPADDPRTAVTDEPTTAHPEVAPDDDPALEPQQQVLAGGLDRLETPAVDPLGDVLHRGARMRRLGRHPLPHQHLEPPRGAGEGVAFGHEASVLGRLLSQFCPDVPAYLNIAAVAKRTGIPADTLRKWEQRYGVLRPTRSGGGHRRYSDVDVGRVEWLKARLDEGYRISEAAAMLGGGSREAPKTPAKLRDAIYDAVVDGDLRRIRSLLDHAFAVQHISRTLNHVISPLLTRTGEGWAAGELTVAQEHLLSAEVRARLDPLAISSASGVRGAGVLACAPGERHELGLLMLAALMRADGWRVVYLGGDTPVAGALSLAAQVDASVLCISAAMPDRLSRLGKELAAAEVPEGLALFLGGRAISEELATSLGAHWTNSDLERAIRDLRKVGR